MSQAEADGPDVGSLGEETAKLLGALAGWAKEQDLGAHAAAWTAGPSEDEHAAGGATDAPHPAECRYCPVCRTVNAVRQINPEARAHLAVAITSFAKAAEALLRTEPPAPERGPVEDIDLGGWDEPAADQ
ncbi:MAG: hypothetical protein ACI379_07135 [Nocardioides sp.]|uniref:hypothetical protein n=1 Tax=Nocardioides sp. TaxID=35761 RepID=UPI003F125625